MNNFVKILLNFLMSILAPKKKETSSISTTDASENVSPPKSLIGPKIDWTDPSAKVSNHFTVKDCLWLPQWKRLATEEDGLADYIKKNLINLCKQMDHIVDLVGKPPKVHVTYRPEEYNILVKGAPNSGHKYGQAMDYSFPGMTCDDVRKMILINGMLEKLDLRMEDLPGSNWIHNDTCSVKYRRFFKP